MGIGAVDWEDSWTGAVTYSPLDDAILPSLDESRPHGLVVYTNGAIPPR